MKLPNPRLKLARVFDDGSEEEIGIVPVTALPWDTRMERRSFLGAAISVGAAMLWMSGCDHTKVSDSSPKMPDPPLEVQKAHAGWLAALAIAPNGKILASGSGDDIKLWSLPEGKLLTTLQAYIGQVADLSITPDGKMLAVGDSNGCITLWDLGQQKFRSFLSDPLANKKNDSSDKGYGRSTTGTLPCGSSIPPNATCICNCVAR